MPNVPQANKKSVMLLTTSRSWFEDGSASERTCYQATPPSAVGVRGTHIDQTGRRWCPEAHGCARTSRPGKSPDSRKKHGSQPPTTSCTAAQLRLVALRPVGTTTASVHPLDTRPRGAAKPEVHILAPACPESRKRSVKHPLIQYIMLWSETSCRASFHSDIHMEPQVRQCA